MIQTQTLLSVFGSIPSLNSIFTLSRISFQFFILNIIYFTLQDVLVQDFYLHKTSRKCYHQRSKTFLDCLIMETKIENKDESFTIIFYNSNPFTVSYKEKRKNNNFRLNRCPKLKVFHMQIRPILSPFLLIET